jgi:hypothetical protein
VHDEVHPAADDAAVEHLGDAHPGDVVQLDRDQRADDLLEQQPPAGQDDLTVAGHVGVAAGRAAIDAALRPADRGLVRQFAREPGAPRLDPAAQPDHQRRGDEGRADDGHADDERERAGACPRM